MLSISDELERVKWPDRKPLSEPIDHENPYIDQYLELLSMWANTGALDGFHAYVDRMGYDGIDRSAIDAMIAWIEREELNA